MTSSPAARQSPTVAGVTRAVVHWAAQSPSVAPGAPPRHRRLRRDPPPMPDPRLLLNEPGRDPRGGVERRGHRARSPVVMGTAVAQGGTARSDRTARPRPDASAQSIPVLLGGAAINEPQRGRGDRLDRPPYVTGDQIVVDLRVGGRVPPDLIRPPRSGVPLGVRAQQVGHLVQ
ncbi:MAG TPA: hypothetical protein VFY84_13945 [Jiangellales bacterium]|nr:hypothetical protein [Jiangellales bacterium]